MPSSDSISALLLRVEGKSFRAAVEQLELVDLPDEGELLVRVQYSSINYKDALAITNQGKIIRGEFPFVPGIDLAAVILESSDNRFKEGDLVIGTGGGLGETSWGGLSSVQRISSRWVVHLPGPLSSFDAMAIGTAGVTGMLSVMALENAGVRPEHGEILITGATGGVGSFAINILSRAGYDTVACTGKKDAVEYLKMLGANRIIDREEFGKSPMRALDSISWAGAVDTVGSVVLAKIISQTARHGSVAVCGMAGGSDLSTSVFPFILRGVNLLGIDSNTCPLPDREKVWARFAEEYSSEFLHRITTQIELEDTLNLAPEFVMGRIKGRYVVRLPE